MKKTLLSVSLLLSFATAQALPIKTTPFYTTY